jgi:threonylcarbamoyladenosine tRNA methylthiotransferase MtaB
VRYSVVTFGCRVNQAESLAVEAALRAKGAEPGESRDADVVIVNSCSVTATADQGTRQAIRKIARENPSARIIVTGCYATREPAAVAALPGVVRLVPNDGKDQLVAHLDDPGGAGVTTADRYAGGRGPCGAFEPARPDGPVGRDGLMLRPGDSGRTAFSLRIQTGCEEACAYCVIPSTRGPSRSTAVGELERHVRHIEGAGYREVTLTGVHLGAYGRDLDSATSLVVLLERLLAVTGRLVFRLGSLEPMDCPPALVDLAAATDRVAPAFHLPLQHASDRVLRAMRRPYSRTDYAAIVDRVRARLPHAAITADAIVGFPGEGDADADVLAAYLEGSPVTQLHVFPYSDRPGTEASRMPGKVHGAVVRDRGARVRAVGQRLAERFKSSQSGRVCRALTVEGGRSVVTDNGLRAEIEAGRRGNEHVQVRLSFDGGRLTATVIGDVGQKKPGHGPDGMTRPGST